MPAPTAGGTFTCADAGGKANKAEKADKVVEAAQMALIGDLRRAGGTEQRLGKTLAAAVWEHMVTDY